MQSKYQRELNLEDDLRRIDSVMTRFALIEMDWDEDLSYEQVQTMILSLSKLNDELSIISGTESEQDFLEEAIAEAKIQLIRIAHAYEQDRLIIDLGNDD